MCMKLKIINLTNFFINDGYELINLYDLYNYHKVIGNIYDNEELMDLMKFN